jgi:cation-transporting ATPase 13A3/4/5
MSNYTKDGYRVIALATKELVGLTAEGVHTVTRNEIESGLTFLGMLILENKLKIETNDIIKELNDCKIRTIMATGDNVLTAISVARQCSIVDSESEVWFGDIATNSETGLEYIEW